MGRRHSSKRHDVWEEWSASRLMTIMACPARYGFQYILKLPSPSNPQAAFGSAVHFLFYRFFQQHASSGNFPFPTKKKFLGFWWLFWWSAVEGSGASPEALAMWKAWKERERRKKHAAGKVYREPKMHGFDSMKDAPEHIAWKSDDQPIKLYWYGRKVVGTFFDLHDSIRHDGQTRWAEKYVSFSWAGAKRYRGYIDRLDLEDDGAVLYDYKWGEYPLYLVLQGPQMTTYQYAYEACIRPTLPDPQRYPLKAIRIYDYAAGAYQEVPLRSPADIGATAYFASEARLYVRGVLTGRPPDPSELTSFVRFRWDDMVEGVMTPTLPVGDHCRYCDYAQQCSTYVRTGQPRMRDAFQKKNEDAERSANVSFLPFASPSANAMATSYTILETLASHAPAQPTLGFELPPSKRPVRKRLPKRLTIGGSRKLLEDKPKRTVSKLRAASTKRSRPSSRRTPRTVP